MKIIIELTIDEYKTIYQQSLHKPKVIEVKQEKTKPDIPIIIEPQKDTTLKRPFYWTANRERLLEGVFFSKGIDKIMEENIFPEATRQEILEHAKKKGMILKIEE